VAARCGAERGDDSCSAGAVASAWPQEQYKLQFDRSYEPIVVGKLIFVPSMVSDRVAAYDTETGSERWRFYCDGPVRFAPVGWKDRIYFVSDDGCLYWLACDDGKLLGKLRLGPSDRKILGNGRLISTWPARGGPVLFDGKIYCAASIWPFMGVFIYSIDADSGEIVWENSGSGSTYTTQPHNSPAFGGVAPQGYLAASDKKLLIPSRTTPACYDRETGETIYYRLSDRGMGKYVGGYDVSIWNDLFFNSSIMHRLGDGERLVRTNVQVTADDVIIAFDQEGDLAGYVPEKVPNAKKSEDSIKAKGLWKAEFDSAIEKVHIKAGQRFYASNRQGLITAVDIPKKGGEAKVSWRYRIKGKVWNMLAGDERLFVITEGGLLYCFGAEQVEPGWHSEDKSAAPEASPGYLRKARRILAEGGAREGYCLLLGVRDDKLLKVILAESELYVIAVARDAETVESLRMQMDEASVYGRRVSILRGDISSLELPPYLASVIIAEDVEAAGFEKPEVFVEKIFHSLRPYGGTAWLGATRKVRKALKRCISSVNLLKRSGALPGSGDWVGNYGDAANTVCSQDELKAPLGMLWFSDDSSFTDVLPRHGHGPAEQVIAGRLFIEGVDSISSRDVYTGRTLWKSELRNPSTFGIYYDSSYNSDYHDISYNKIRCTLLTGRNAASLMRRRARSLIFSHSRPIRASRRRAGGISAFTAITCLAGLTLSATWSFLAVRIESWIRLRGSLTSMRASAWW